MRPIGRGQGPPTGPTVSANRHQEISSRPGCLSSRSILNWTRRTASSNSLASVLPDLTRSPIRNCHFQMPGVSDLVSLYSTPLWFMGNLPHGHQCERNWKVPVSDCELLGPPVTTLGRKNARLVPCCIRAQRTAPHKRSMLAWRRRLIPRVMQCPRQLYVWAALKKVQRFPDKCGR